MRAPTILWLLLRSRKTDLLLVVGEPRDYHAGETGSREGSWKRRRLYTFQLFDHTASKRRNIRPTGTAWGPARFEEQSDLPCGGWGCEAALCSSAHGAGRPLRRSGVR